MVGSPHARVPPLLPLLARGSLAFALLIVVAGAAAWLLSGWSNLLGPPSNQDLIVIAISPDSNIVYENGQARSSSGTSMWSGPHTGQWGVVYGLPLAALVALALVPVVQLSRSVCRGFTARGRG
jgi:hypothetical protein